MDPLYWVGSIGVTIIFGFLFGRKIDKSYELAKWLGFGIIGYWLIWTFALISIFAAYIFHGKLAIYPGILVVLIFHLNHRQMRRSRKNEEFIADVDRLDNQVLSEHIKTIIKDPIDTLQTHEKHRKKLINALKTANETVVILSGWAVSYAEDKEFRSILGGCLKRGVMVYIGYGNQNSGTKTIERSVKQETSETLDNLMEWCVNKKWEGRLEVFYYAGQSNALIKDDKYAIIGGLNWLSDSGSLNTDELSWIISNRDFIIQERDKIVMGHQE